MTKCACGKWTPAIYGQCASCYEGAVGDQADAATRNAIAWVREQESLMEPGERPADKVPKEI